MAIVSKVEVTTKRTQTIILSAEEVLELVREHIFEKYKVGYSGIKLDAYDFKDVRVVVETIEIKEED